MIAAYQGMIQEQLDEGLRAIQHSANTLMHEIAAEVWRGAGGDKGEVASTILQELSRDQAIRSLIAHSDERFQSLAARTGRLEDTMNMLAETVRAARDEIARSADALADAPGSPLGIEEVRGQVATITNQVTASLETLAERDRAIVQIVHDRVREHGRLISQETSRISQALEAYVQQGVEAMGRLAGSADAQMESMGRLVQGTESQIEAVGRLAETADERLQGLARQEEEIGERIRASVDREMASLGEQLQLLYERMAIGATSVHEELTFISDRIGVDARETIASVTRALEGRTMALAQLVRSDSEAILSELVRTAGAHDERVAELLDDRLRPVADAFAEVAISMANEIPSRIRDEVAQAVGIRLDESAERLDRTIEALGSSAGEREAQLGRHLDQVVERFDARLDDVVERLGTRADEQERRVDGRMDEQERRIDGRMDETERRFDGRMDETVAAIDRNVIRMADALEGHVERLGHSVAEQASTAADQAIATRFDDVLSRLHDASLMIERAGANAHAMGESSMARFDEMARSVEDRQQMLGAELAGRQQTLHGELEQSLDQRIAALAKLVRSDNETLAQQIVADQEASKQALRAMKELQANLPPELIHMVEERFGSLAESIERSNEMLAARIDRMAETIGRRQNDDIQVVIDRMGDAMHALASLGKGGVQPPSEPRIELD
ncbi:MAG TPA: hypothetical protein VIC58_08440 [Actinomycetota bacterium]